MSKIQEALEKIREEEHGAAAAGNRPAKTAAGDEEAQDSANVEKMGDLQLLSAEELERKRIIFPEMKDHRVFNAFRDLRTSIRKAVDIENPVVMVTGTTPNAGSSFVALNLARAIALDDGVTSLAVDCNLHNPSFNDLAIDKSDVGLRDYLKDNSLVAENIIHPCGIKRFRVIPAGKKEIGVTEFFTSTRLRQLMRELKNRYPDRNIVVDSPPISVTADTRILAEICDCVILVVKYGKSRKSDIAKATSSFGKDKLVGVVFNDEPGLLV